MAELFQPRDLDEQSPVGLSNPKIHDLQSIVKRQDSLVEDPLEQMDALGERLNRHSRMQMEICRR